MKNKVNTLNNMLVSSNDNLPRISVIVPIYNVEKYVRKCLESLLHQTMKQIEIICVDDGSTDGSGTIADEYERINWPIFKIIHTKNRGLSAARNRGLDEAQAEWVMFVDSDDWVESRFCEVPWSEGVRKNADLVIFGMYNVKSGRIKKLRNNDNPTGFINHEKAIDVGNDAVWNKLYKRQLFDSIRYPEGRVYEEIGTTYKLHDFYISFY